jgi:hypothetical protein
MSVNEAPILIVIKMKRERGKIMYMVIDLNGKSVGDDLNDCLKITCSNKKAVSVASGIRYNRVVYAFMKQKKSYLVENDKLILKSDVYYKGSQPGGFRHLETKDRVVY